jgi:uncharacterized protein YkwD
LVQAWDGRTFDQRIAEQGVRYRRAGENIAAGEASAAEVIGAWMASAGHRANILNPEYSRIGVGYAPCDGGHLWTQVFAD